MPGIQTKSFPTTFLRVSIFAGCVLIVGLLAVVHGHLVAAKEEPNRIIIDYPLNGSVFPPDMAPPTFLWHDPAPTADSWHIDIDFGEGSAPIHVESKGERMHIGEIDPRCISANNKLPELTPEQAAAHTWKPEAATWEAIKKHAGGGPITITIHGYARPIEHSRNRARTCRCLSRPIL